MIRSSSFHHTLVIIIINHLLLINGSLTRIEVDEIENIQKEVENNAIDLKSVEER